MFKTLCLALLLCFTRSQTNLVPPDDASVPVGMDEHCAPSDDFGYCHCTVRDVEGYVVETRWVRIDPSVDYCDDIRLSRDGMGSFWVDVAPRQVCDANGDEDGARACMEASACDLTIKGVGVYPHLDEGKLQLSVSIATSKDRSGLYLGVVYKNTTEVPDWIKVDARHPLLVINGTKDYVRNDDLALYAFLGNCSDVLFFFLRPPNPYVDWLRDNFDDVKMVIDGMCLVCNVLGVVVSLVMMYKTCTTQRWRGMSLCDKVGELWVPVVVLSFTVMSLYIFIMPDP